MKTVFHTAIYCAGIAKQLGVKSACFPKKEQNWNIWNIGKNVFAASYISEKSEV